MSDRALQMRNNISLLIDFSRSRQALLSVAQPGLGALLAQGGLPSLRIVGLGLVASVSGMLSVFASNDLLDLKVDREAAKRQSREASPEYDLDVVTVRHPVAAGMLPLSWAVSWVVILGVISLVCAFLLRPGCALIFVGCICLEALYCGLKRRNWLKTIPSGFMVGLGGLAGWYAVRDFDWYALAFFFLLVFWEIFGRNLTNDLADMSHDAPLGIQTLATVHGATWSARATFWGAAATVPIAAIQPGGPALRLLMAGGVVWSMAVPALGLARSPEERTAQKVFNRASLFPPVAFVMVLLIYTISHLS